MKHFLPWIAFPLLGALALAGCQKEYAPPPASEEETQASAPQSVGLGADWEQAAIMAQFGGLPSGYDAYVNNLPQNYIRGLVLPMGEELKRICPPPPKIGREDRIEWVGQIAREKHTMEVPISMWGPREHAIAKAMNAAYGGAGSDAGPMSMGNLAGEPDMEGKKIEHERWPEGDYIGPGGGGGGDYGGGSGAPGPSDPSTIGVHVVRNKWAREGDIYVKNESSSASLCSYPSGMGYIPNESAVNFAIPGRWKHAAIMDTTARYAWGYNKCLLSASDRTDSHDKEKGILGRVGYDVFDGYWSNATEIGVYRVMGASDEVRRNAVLYAEAYKDCQFNFLTPRDASSTFYCSKLVWRAWYSQGYDLEPRKDSYTGLPWIPVLIFWRWNYEQFWFIRIWYPEFRVYWIRDIWVTPTDLTKTSDTYQVKIYSR